MTVLLSIGDFSRMTHLSVKALRHYHDVGLLEPADVDRSSGYRLYATDQVPVAQVIRRFRDLGMPVDQVKEVIAAPDVATRNQVIVAHLERMEVELEETRSTVASLRRVLEAPSEGQVTFRSLPPQRALLIGEHVTSAGMEDWWVACFQELRGLLGSGGGVGVGVGSGGVERAGGERAGVERAGGGVERAGVERAGGGVERASVERAGGGVERAAPDGCLYPGEMFELEEGHMVAYLPIGPGGPPQGPIAGRVEVGTVPAVELALLVHAGSYDDLDRTYGALGTYVSGQAIGVDGPIREHYLVGPLDDPDPEHWRTEVGWPVFRTAPAGGG